MPTVILLDVSLSMCRTVKNLATKDANSSGESIEVKQLANVGIGTLLDYFAQSAQLEHTALVVFSSLWEVKYQFTRHHESIKDGIYDLELYDRSNVVNALRGILSLKLHEWAQHGPINIILITDGQILHQGMLKSDTPSDNDDGDSDEGEDFHDIPISEIEGQFDFPCKLQIVCLTSAHEPALKQSIPFFKKLVSIVDQSTQDCPVISGSNLKNIKQSAIWLPESDGLDLSVQAIEDMFTRLAEHHHRPYQATLSCGHLSSMVILSPKPSEYLLEPLKNEFDELKKQLSTKSDRHQETYVAAINRSKTFKLCNEISICGFLPLSEIATPAVVSKHIILPVANNKFNETLKAEQILSQKDVSTAEHVMEYDAGELMQPATKIKAIETGTPGRPAKHHLTGANEQSSSNVDQDITKQPSFCALLHNALKQESYAAICVVGKCDATNEDWFGMLHAHTDSKRRSSLELCLFVPNPNPIMWLPSLKTMGSAQLNADLPAAIRDKMQITASAAGSVTGSSGGNVAGSGVGASRTVVKSYSSNSVIWLDPESVQTDVQRIVRHAKRSPDKAPHFYKELNRIRRAAISYGFYDVLFGLADILEREMRVMRMDTSKPINQETLNHIEHVVACLRAGLSEDSYETNITPKV